MFLPEPDYYGSKNHDKPESNKMSSQSQSKTNDSKTKSSKIDGNKSKVVKENGKHKSPNVGLKGKPAATQNKQEKVRNGPHYEGRHGLVKVSGLVIRASWVQYLPWIASLKIQNYLHTLINLMAAFLT
jgi:hypothetical protein